MTTPTAIQPARNVVSPGTHAMTKAGEWTNREAQIVANVIAPGLSPVELSAFAAVCRHTNLDPFRRQIYAIKRGGKMTIQVAIDGYRSLASRSGEYLGQLGPEWCGPDGQWRDVWIDEKPPAAARVAVKRRGFDDPVWATVTYREFYVDNSGLWKSHPAHMLAVRAESHALRRAFPETFAAFEGVASSEGVSVTVEAVVDEEIPALNAGPDVPANAGEEPAETTQEDVRSDQPEGSVGDGDASPEGSASPSPAELELTPAEPRRSGR